MILQIPDYVLEMIADFVMIGGWDKYYGLCERRSQMLELHGPMAALFGAESLVHTSKRTASSMVQLRWRFNQDGVCKGDDFWFAMRWSLEWHCHARIVSQCGGFLFPYAWITKRGCSLEYRIIRQLRVHRSASERKPCLHLHEWPLVQANCELYTSKFTSSTYFNLLTDELMDRILMFIRCSIDKQTFLESCTLAEFRVLLGWSNMITAE